MTQPLFSPAALEDIENIWDYTVETWGIDQAERYTDAIRDACFALATGEKQGRNAFEIREGYFKHATGRHLIFFIKTGEGLAVIRVLHQSMDFETHL